MKKAAEIFYILFRILSLAVAWILFAALVTGSVIEILDLDRTLFLCYAYYIVLDILQKYALLLVLPFIGMFGTQYLMDHVAKRKPVYLGMVQLADEMIVWVLKHLPIYVGIRVECRIVYLFMNSHAQNVFLCSFMDIMKYLLFSDWMLLLLIAVLAVTHFICAKFSNRK